MSAHLGLVWVAGRLGTDLQAPARRAGGAARLWRACGGDLAAAFRGDGERAQAFDAARSAFDATSAAEAVRGRGAWFVRAGGPGWPQRLRALPDPPFGLIGLGGPAELDGAPVVAIVGTRRPTGAGLRFARELAAGLAARGATIVSGLALGIDAAAHAGALDAGGRTVAVLGCGVDHAHPRPNRRLRERIATSSAGTVCSEYWLDVQPAPWRFPARNRIVAGLADAVVVIEAAERSGALITADFAMELGRPVLAVPGPARAAMSAGCHALLRAGAGFCEDPQDVVDELPGSAWRDVSAQRREPPDPLARAVYEMLTREPARADEIVVRADAAAGEVMAALGRLELAGLAVRGDGQRWWAAPSGGAAT